MVKGFAIARHFTFADIMESYFMRKSTQRRN